jgi:hypothetical protein
MDTEIKLKGDKVIAQIPSIKDKALRINLNENIYGTFAEIELARNSTAFFFWVLQELSRKPCQLMTKTLVMRFMVLKLTDAM